MINKERVAFAFETITVPSGNVAAAFTASVYQRPNAQPPIEALVTVNAGPIMSYLMIATATVSSTVGHKLAAFGSLIVTGPDSIINFRTTSVSSGTTGSISVTYFRGVG